MSVGDCDPRGADLVSPAGLPEGKEDRRLGVLPLRLGTDAVAVRTDEGIRLALRSVRVR